MAYVTYILRSESLGKFYTGHTDKLHARLRRHNEKGCRSTSVGVPWHLIYQAHFATRSEAIAQERQIKKMGARKFIRSTEASSLADDPFGVAGACPPKGD